MNDRIQLLHLYVSPGHNFFGHHGQAPGRHPIHEAASVCCVAGRGIEGDRFFDHQENYKGQITFFADEVHQYLCDRFGVHHKPPSVYRRNIVTRGVNLGELVGVQFELQGVRFLGVEECRPCQWMDHAFCPGAEAAMRGRGGLRARMLTTGTLKRGEVTDFRIQPAEEPANEREAALLLETESLTQV